MRDIIILANKYPNIYEPNVNVFTQQVAWALLEADINVTIICPNPINYRKQNINIPFKSVEHNEQGKRLTIYRQKYVGMGQEVEHMQKLCVDVTTKMYINAVNRILKNSNLENTVLFAEFLCPSGVAASVLGKKYRVNSYMQIGEATYQGDKKYGNERLKKLLEPLTGVIALSGYIRDYLLNANIIDQNKITILPSGYRKNRIYKRDKVEARKKLGLPLNKFIVGFCGSFDDRKGILRLEKAIDGITDNNVVLAACGKGKCSPESKKLVWNGPINHEDLAWFYSALDVFAFPTYYEGCCTAIVEAMACGCPIISSDRSFNYEICDESNSILIEPDDISAMRKAILTLKNDENIQISMSKASLRKSIDLSLDKKATKMIEFMNLK